MKKTFVVLFSLCIILTGCQKSVNDAPATASDAPAEQAAPAEATAPAAQAAPAEDAAPSGDAVNEEPPSAPERMVLGFDELGLDESRLKPAFASKVLTKNGEFALLYRGNFRYYLVSENDDTVSDEQYKAYCSSVLSYIQSISDGGEVWNYDVNANAKQDKISGDPNVKLSDIFGITYDIKGKSYVLYIRYYKYKEGTFSDMRTPVNAVNVSAWIID